MALPLRRGGEGGKTVLLKKNYFFIFYFSNSKVPTAIKLEGGLRP